VLAYSKDMLDISSETMVAATLHRYQPDIVINAAAYTNVEQAEVFPELASQINIDAVGVLACACNSNNVPLLHISTDYVFSGKKQTPYVETDETEPLSVYGSTKLAGEKLLMASTKKFIILRTSWVFSATGNNFVKTMWRLFHERAEVKVVSDQWGAPTSADAIASTLLTIATRVLNPSFHGWGIYHYSGAPAVSWYDFACAIQRVCPQENLALQHLLSISTHEFLTKATRPAYAVLAMQKINTVFEIDACDWQKDLKEVIQKLRYS
jgi:dTDP-4-dehydrorhamnose reductase